MDDLQEFLDIAREAVIKASEFLTENYGGIKDSHKKSDSHYSIKEDKECNDIYEKYFKEKTPDFSLYTEEGTKELENKYVWVVDPIEGTSNYRVENPFFATQVALLKDGEPVVSVVNAPILKQEFYAKKGAGAFMNNNKITTSSITEIDEALISLGKGTMKKHFSWYAKSIPRMLDQVRTFRHYGACGLEMSYVAAGKIDAYVNFGSQIYDYVPGALIITEAGGMVINHKGADWTIEDDYLLASNPHLVDKIKSILD